MANKGILNSKNLNMNNHFYKLSVKNPKGETIKMEEFKDKAVLIVNTATKCGLAPQFDGLEKLHQEYKDKGLVVLGFPCNQFLGQEPESNETVEQACKINFGVSFPLTEKIKVNGSGTHEVFKYLKKQKGGLLSSAIKWNFTKFLIDKNGFAVERYSPQTEPKDIEGRIKELLKL
jgi:glutathione peroxidase